MTSLSVALRGGQRPRVRNVPPYATSSGQEAVELAASAGLVLDPWQAFILEDALGERADGKWAAFEVGVIVPRQNGKGGVTEARELAGLFLFGERLILHSAHEFKTAAEAFLRVKALVDNTDDLRRQVARVRTGAGTEAIELLNGARLRFVARSKGSGRGFSGDCVILDEAYALTDEEMAALLPTLSARPNAQVWYTSTPPKDPAATLVALRKRGEAGDRDLAYFDFGAEGPASAVNLDDPAVWAGTNPALGIRISEETVARERAALSDADFARERLGVWPPSVGGQWQVIDEASWRSRIDVESQCSGRVVFAADVTPDRRYASIAVAGWRADGGLHVEVVDHRPGTGWVVPRLIDLRAKWDAAAIVLDPGGPAGSLLADLECNVIEPKIPSAREVGQGCGQLWDSVCGESPDLRHIDQPQLAVALSGAVKRPLGDAWAWSRRDSSVDLSPLVAVTLAAWGLRSEPPQLQAVPLVAWR